MKKILIVYLFLFAFASVSVAQVSERDQKVFTGFNRVSVGIGDSKPSVALGLNMAQVKTDVEETLKDAGFIIDNNAPQQIYINIRTQAGANNLVSYAVILYLDQPVVLQRNPNARFYGTTWDISSISSSTTANFVNNVRSDIVSLVDEFVNKYNTANQIRKNSADSNQTGDNEGFAVTKTAPTLPPQLVIQNKTGARVFLTVNGKSYVVLPRSTKEIFTDPGNVNYQARVAGYKAFALRKLFLKQGEAYSLSYTLTR